LSARVAALAKALPAAWRPQLAPGESAVGGGALPGSRLPTTLVLLEPGELGAHGLALRLRLGRPAIVPRIVDERVALDPRTLPLDFPGANPTWPTD
jgi:L-seryl-tRNA(Ser) seleniumtransferase